jgi:hypothetical protein
MVKQKCIPLDAPQEWKEALRGVKHAFAHTWENCYAMHLTTRFKTYLYCFEDGDVRIVCPIAEREYDGFIDIVTPYGFSGFAGDRDCPEFPQCWRQFVEEKAYVCAYIQLNPLLENSTYSAPQEIRRYNSVYVMDLTLSVDEIIDRMSRNRRKQVKRIIDNEDNIILDRRKLTDFLLDNFSDFFRRKNASSTYDFSPETFSFLCGLDNVSIVGAGNQGHVEAVSLLAYTQYMGEALFQFSLPEGRRHAVEMVWHRLNYLKSIGVPLMNLGGGVCENDSLAKFKEQFGGKKLPLGCLKQIYRPEVYEMLCKRKQVDPRDISGYFPAYRRPLNVLQIGQVL